MHSHAHHHPTATGRVLQWSLLATGAFVVFELAAGFHAHSLALISDAGHNFTDALALLLTWLGVYFQSKPASDTKTFGYQRAGVLAAFVNALTLLALSVWIVVEAVQRLRNPEKVEEWWMLAVAGAAVVLNGGIMWGLNSARRHDVSVRSAYVHMLGDLLGAVAIIAGALVIHYTGWQQVDSILSVAIAVLVIWTAWDIVKESLNILLEGTPRGVALPDVHKAMREVEGVLDVHDLHVWSLGTNSKALSSHMLIDDMPPSESDCILKRVNHLLADRFQIHHTTIQFEHMSCMISEKGCVIPVSADSHQHHHHH